jgi:AraC-like DNA-binding protein
VARYSGGDLVSRTQRLLVRLAERPTLTRVAGKLGMSARTLQRRLEAHGVTFRTLLEQARTHYVLLQLERSSAPIASIARDLGYSSVTSFDHAFRRWKSVTPSAWRRSMAGRGR